MNPREFTSWIDEFEASNKVRFSEGLREVLRIAMGEYSGGDNAFQGVITPSIVLACLKTGKVRPDRDELLAHLFRIVGSEVFEQMGVRYNDGHFPGPEVEEIINQPFPAISTFGYETFKQAARLLPQDRNLLLPVDFLVSLTELLPEGEDTTSNCQVLFNPNESFRSLLYRWLNELSNNPSFPDDLSERLKKIHFSSRPQNPKGSSSKRTIVTPNIHEWLDMSQQIMNRRFSSDLKAAIEIAYKGVTGSEARLGVTTPRLLIAAAMTAGTSKDSSDFTTRLAKTIGTDRLKNMQLALQQNLEMYGSGELGRFEANTISKEVESLLGHAKSQSLKNQDTLSLEEILRAMLATRPEDCEVFARERDIDEFWREFEGWLSNSPMKPAPPELTIPAKPSALQNSRNPAFLNSWLLDFQSKNRMIFSGASRETIQLAGREYRAGVPDPEIKGITTASIFLAALETGETRPDRDRNLAKFFQIVGVAIVQQMRARFGNGDMAGSEIDEILNKEDPTISNTAQRVLQAAAEEPSGNDKKILPVDILVSLAEDLAKNPDAASSCQHLVAKNESFLSLLQRWLTELSQTEDFPPELKARLNRINPNPRDSTSAPPESTDPDGESSVESSESGEEDLPTSNARRGPRSLLPHHPPDASPFRRLVEPERNQFDEFLRKANLNLSYACWNANVIAWEDTAALGDTNRAPIVTCASVFIGFLDTGLAESEMATEGSLPAALARTMEMSSERLTRFRIEATLASQPKEEASLVHGDESLLLLWQHASKIAGQCTEDKIIAARHLLAAFLFVFESEPKIQDDLANLGFNPTITNSLLQEHLRMYETANHPGWRAFFQKLGVPISSSPITFGTGITTSRYNSLCLGIEKTSAAIAEIFRSARNPQSLPDSKGKKRERVSDFVFALYGPWGRGKSTLMSSVAARLTQDPDVATPTTGAKCILSFEWLKSPWRWLSGILFGYQQVTRNYAALEFSAWKYPSRPEVWVHLYERVRELAESNSLLQRLRLSFRLGLLESGWWPLLFGFILLAVARLPLADLAGGIWKASGWLGCLLIAGFFLRVFRIGALVGQRYMKIPSHADKLGLQAVIGRDLKNLLQVWITPPNIKYSNDKLSTIDFRWFQKGWWLSFVILVLIAFSVWQACQSIQKDHMLQIEKSAALHEKRIQLPSTNSIQAKVHFPLGELHLNIPATYPVVQTEAPKVVTQDPFWIYVVLIGTGAIAIIAGWIITRPPKQHETLLLTVDDLDRCDSDQMLAVIDSLRLFLDDQEMSQRLQMAMLLDRGLLQESLRDRIKQAGIDGTDDQHVRNFHRTHREKVFLCEFSMPPLQEHERNELLKSLFPNAEPLQQRPAISTTAAPTATKAPESPRTREPSTSDGPALSAVPTDQPKTEEPENTKSQNVPGKPGAVPKTSKHDRAPAVEKSEELPPQSDTSALVHAISRIPSKQLTPRSMLMLKVRFELVRLLLKHQLEDYKPDDATLSGIATSLVEDLFPGISFYSAPLPPEIKSVVDQVTSN